ncbi:aminodeoxychorismate/anthranilate synthase component II [Oxyplasma meridianum]|uniref:anthranilate synthase n=1 Tax=Oxyplasma meridianum TaxID=3073602 RepID=A0AAX4NEP8_9ARCH
MKVLMIDNYDSFVNNLVDYIRQEGADVHVVTNDRLSDIDPEKYQAVVISPGPGNPLNPCDRGEIMEFFPLLKGKKVLGICFGHQILAMMLGSKIKISQKIYHGEVDRISNDGYGVFRNLPGQINVARYHSLVVEPSENIIVDAVSESDGNVMAFHSASGNITGLQFHPESYYSEFGHEILRNFLEM